MESGDAMAERKWAELNNDCLTQIFARAGTESLAQSIQFVCKSWYRATFDPRCWTTLIFPSALYSINSIKYAVGRAQRSATVVEFEPGFDVTSEVLICIAEGCPLLKTLILSDYVSSEYCLLLSELIGNWHHLEYFQICFIYHIEQILESISLHCSNFVGFFANNTHIFYDHVSAIEKYTPKIKLLRMQNSSLPRECLVMLLKGCAALETLDVSGCVGFKEDDDEIIKLASHIKSFNCSGARLDDGDEYYDDAAYGDRSNEYYEDDVLSDDEYNSDEHYESLLYGDELIIF